MTRSNAVSPINTRLQLLCIWAGPAFFVLYLIFFMGIAHFIPPTAPSRTPEEIAALFDGNRMGIRIGQIGGLIASTLLFPFFTVLTAQMARIERAGGRNLPVLSIIQFGGAALLVVYFQLCGMIWIIASYRPDLSPETLRLLDDAGWLIFVMVFPAFVLQLVCVGICSLIDQDENPVWPRWVGYLNFWVAAGGAGGGIAVFFYSGPFAWNGIIGFFIPVIAFSAWLGVMTWTTAAGIKRQALEGRDPAVEPAELVG